MSKPKMSAKTKTIWILLILGFMAMEFPGVFFFQSIVDPFILGVPFIYGYIMCLWVYMCVILLYAYKTNWGKSEGGKK